MRRTLLPLAAIFVAALSLAGCASNDNANINTTATTNASPPAATPAPSAQNLEVVERPQTVKDKMASRGEQDQASPVLKFVEPRDGATINNSTVNLKLTLSGDLKGYKPMKDPATGMGNHIHVILDNQPYEAYYNLDQPFELRNVSEGKHTIRVFASRPWHESYKNAGSFQMVTFTVKGGGSDASKPTTTNGGQVMADNKSGSNMNTTVNTKHPIMPANSNTASSNTAAPPREGKDMATSTASDVDAKKPLLTYSRPKGEYKGADTEAIMIDFWLSNAKLQGDGGDFRVRYTVDGGEAKYIDKWEPIWLKGWGAGKHTVKLELVGKDGNPVANGDYNSTSREITVTP
jgi:outer membrane murein-binding lipoprotein Lpp